MIRVVIYTRYSSTLQREASTEDQARNCRRRIEAEGWQLVHHFRDEAVSGSVSDRPGYQQLLRAADSKGFELLMVDDLSRLSRDQVESERVIRRLEFRGIRIVAVSDGYDSQSKSRKVQRGVRALMNEVYLDDLRDKTRRGLAGVAIRKFWAGGRPYGYTLKQMKDEARRDSYNNPLVVGTTLEIEPAQAEVVREIFEKYANDMSQRAIAAELNTRAVPSPGSTWSGRTIRRTSGWLGSTINSLLTNQLYRGKYIWNKTEWIRNPDNGRRTTRARPESERITHDMPELRIISDALYQRVLERRGRAAIRGKAVSEGITKSRGASGRGGPRFAFSGLLRCELCNSSLVIIGGTERWRAYGCSGNKFGGKAVCSNALSVRKDLLQARLVEPIKRDLLSPAFLTDLQARVIQKIAARPKAQNHAARISVLREQISNLAEAAASGAFRASPALAHRLAQAEAELDRYLAEAPRPLARIIDLPARLTERMRKLIDTLELNLDREPNRARAAIREIVGPVIPVRPHASGRFLIARLGLSEQLVMAAAGSERFVVAGGGFDLYINHPLTLRIVQASLSRCPEIEKTALRATRTWNPRI